MKKGLYRKILEENSVFKKERNDVDDDSITRIVAEKSIDYKKALVKLSASLRNDMKMSEKEFEKYIYAKTIYDIVDLSMFIKNCTHDEFIVKQHEFITKLDDLYFYMSLERSLRK